LRLLLRRLSGGVVFIAILAYALARFFGVRYLPGPYGLAILAIIFTSVSAWVIGIEMRHKIRKVLGRKATDEDLTSIDTWMKVDEVEEENGEKKPIS
jgi:hypothetical protein